MMLDYVQLTAPIGTVWSGALSRLACRAHLQLDLAKSVSALGIKDILNLEPAIRKSRDAFIRPNQQRYAVPIKRDRHQLFTVIWDERLDCIIDVIERDQ